MIPLGELSGSPSTATGHGLTYSPVAATAEETGGNFWWVFSHHWILMCIFNIYCSAWARQAPRLQKQTRIYTSNSRRLFTSSSFNRTVYGILCNNITQHTDVFNFSQLEILHLPSWWQAAGQWPQVTVCLRTLWQHGLLYDALLAVFQAITVNRLSYASPAWQGFASTDDWNQLEAFLSIGKIGITSQQLSDLLFWCWLSTLFT